MKKRILSLFLVIATMLAIAVPTLAAEAKTFTDVSANADYAAAVAWCYEKGLMQGVSATNFGPNSTLTRAMVATVLYRADGEPAVAGEPAFTDTQPNAWYSNAVAWANNKGIVQGYGNGLFGTNDPITKEQLDVIIRRYNGEEPVWMGNPALAVAATRSEAAVAFYTHLRKEEAQGDGKILVAYYSATGSTERVAQTIANTMNADLFEIVPINAYTTSDLSWTTSGSRVNREHDDENLRDIELVKTTPDNWADYDTVFIGYPIWWQNASWVVNNFVKDNDFTGKAVIPFCTSSSSGLGESDKNLAAMTSTGDWLPGQRFQSSASQSTVESWVNGLDLPQPQPEAPASKPSDASHITSVQNVPLITLNNGVQVPQLGLGTQIQRLERDSSEAGRKLLNDTSHDAVVAALQAGYRHLDTAHGYFNESGVGQGIRDSGVPREEIWVTSKLWPSEYGEGTTMQAIDDMLERLQLDYLDCIYLHHPAGDYEGAWKDLEKAYEQGKVRALGISNFDNWPEAFNAIVENSTVKPQIMQIEGHPFAQRHATRELAERYNIQVECWYPLGHADDRLLNNEVLSQIAQAHNKSVVQIILRWHMQEGLCAVPGSTNPDHIKENISIFDFALTDAEMAQIRAMDRGEEGRYFNINYEQMGGFFARPLG